MGSAGFPGAESKSARPQFASGQAMLSRLGVPHCASAARWCSQRWRQFHASRDSIQAASRSSIARARKNSSNFMNLGINASVVLGEHIFASTGMPAMPYRAQVVRIVHQPPMQERWSGAMICSVTVGYPREGVPLQLDEPRQRRLSALPTLVVRPRISEGARWAREVHGHGR